MKSETVIIVSGSRTIGEDKKWKVIFEIEDLFIKYSNPLLIHGDYYRGIDDIAKKWAIDNNQPQKPFPANWLDMSEPCIIGYNKSGSYNKLAGFKRNQKMANEGHILLAIIDKDNPKSPGTRDMIKRAKKQGLIVHIKYI